MLDAADVVRGLGGHARYGEIVVHTTQAALRRAVTAGALRRLRRGLYGLPDLPALGAVAAASGGVISHSSAARALGLSVALTDDLVHVTLRPGARRSRRLTNTSCTGAHWPSPTRSTSPRRPCGRFSTAH